MRLLSNFRSLYFFPHCSKVLDEADRLLDMEFTESLDKILKLIPKERTTYLYSATMTTKVAKLQRASLTNPVRVEVSSKCVPSLPKFFLLVLLTYLGQRYQTVSTLLQYYLLMPLKEKEPYFVYLINTLAQNSIIVFTRTKADAQR